MHAAQCLAVDRRARDQYSLAHHRFILFLPVDVFDGADKGSNGLRVVFSANDVEFVAYMEQSVAVGYAHMAIMKDACTHKITVQEVVHLHHGLALKIRVANLQCHDVRFHGCVLSLLFIQFLLFLVQTHMAQIPHGNGGSDDAQHTKGIGTGIT